MWNLIGHEQAVARLASSLQAGQIAHAYLITGPEGIGKSTLALRLSQALNCQADDAPCGHCDSCVRIARGNHPEVQTIQLEGAAESEEGAAARKSINIEQVDDLLRSINLSRLEGSYRVFTIVGAENLNAVSANRLLKVLEEPPPRVVIILTATDASAVLPTISSRCRQIRLRPVPTRLIEAHLQEVMALPAPRAQLLAKLSGGRVGWALDAASDEAEMAAREELLQLIGAISEANFSERVVIAGKWATDFGQDRAAVYRTLDLWALWWRDLLALQAGMEELVTNSDQMEMLQAQAANSSSKAALAYVSRIEAARDQLEHNVNPRLAIEALLLNAPVWRAN